MGKVYTEDEKQCKLLQVGSEKIYAIRGMYARKYQKTLVMEQGTVTRAE